ncbi:MAG: autotransporter-associated beta strand repeat-containing protein, partial [Verrucomicrobia bacterium]|nr:autotransporter-associated beta strand repeat-containing protein [Verrucomicrobiota bacterium]
TRIVTSTIRATQQTGQSVLNMDGGLLHAFSSGTFMTGLTAAIVYKNGVTFDTSNNVVTVAQNLSGATGYGLVNIAVADGGAGYIGAPAVVIGGGLGTGATAYAQVDMNPLSARYQQVTNIVVATSGMGYQSNDNLQVTLQGGGYLQPAQLGAFTLAPNTGDGSLYKIGAGTLVLSGNNSYSGATVISNGVVQVGNGGVAGTLGSGAVTNSGLLVFNRGDTVYTNTASIAGAGAVLSLGTGMVTFAGVNTYGGGTWVSNGVLQFNGSASIPAAGLVSVASNAAVAMNFAGIQGSFGQFDTTNTFGTIALAAGSANDAAIDFNVAGLSNAWLGAVGVVNYTGVFTPFGTNYQFGGGGGVLSITNVLEDDLTVSEMRNVLIGGGGPAGVVVLLGTNIYHGITVINSGTLRADELQGLGIGNLSINGGILEVGPGFNRAIGTDIFQVQLSGYAGFSSFGGPGAVIDLFGDGSTVTWGAPGFTPTNFVLNGLTANTNIAFLNGLDLGGLNRTVSVLALTATMSGNISNGTLTKAGTGTLVLTGNNGNFSNFINGGTLKIGANDTLWTNSFLSFGDNTNSPNGGGTLDLSDFSQTLGGLVVQTTNFFSTNSIVIGAGQQLSVLGSVIVGADSAVGPQTNGGFANLVMSGAGSFVVTNLGGTFRISAGDSITNNGIRAMLDMSGLATANINLGTAGSFLLGDLNPTAGGIGNDSSLLILASNSTITAGNLSVGPGSRSAGLQVMRLGHGTNILNVNTLNVGTPTAAAPRDGGTLVFNSSTGTLILRAADGVGRTTFSVGAGASGTGAAMTNTVDFTGHNVDLLLGMLTVAEQSRSGNSTNVFSFDTGILDANGMRIGNRPVNTALNTANNFAGIVNIGGGVVTIGGSGIVMGTSYGTNVVGTNFATLNISGGAVTVGSNIIMLTQNSRTSSVYSTINLSGGSLTVLSNIITGVGIAGGTTRVATINLNGGLLDMTGHSIGTNNALIDALNFQSGTLQNVAQINDGGNGFSKGGTGTLTLAGSNAFSSSTAVTNGTLALTGIATGFGTLGVTGATVAVTGTGYFNNVSVDGGATVNIASGAVLGFSNSYLNGVGAALIMNGGLLTNAAATDVLTNLGSVRGAGTLAALVDNRAGAYLSATGGTLELTRGFWNAANYGALEAFGPGSVLLIDQTFTNYGSILMVNGGLVRVQTLVNTANIVINGSTGTFNSLQQTNGGVIYVVSNATLNVTGDAGGSAGSGVIVSNSTMNLGNWLGGGFWLDPSTGHVGNVTLTPGNWFGVDADSALFVSGSWDNQLTNRAGESLTPAPDAYNFRGALVFTNALPGSPVATQQVEVASVRTGEADMAATNFFIGTFQVGDAVTGNNAHVRLVDDRLNAPAGSMAGNEILAASNLIVALSSSVLDWNNRSGFAYNLSNSGTMQWTNAGNPAGAVIRMDVVNTFTNRGRIEIGNGTALQFSNAFLNGPTWGVLALFNGGVLTDFATGGVLTNAGTIHGSGAVTPAVANLAGATVAADLGTLLLGGGLAGNVNNGTLSTTNAGTLAVNNAALTNSVSGRIGLMGGVFTLTGGGSNVVNHGVVMGFGTHAAVLDNRSGGSVVATGGTLRLTAGLTNNVGAAVNAGLLAALGANAQLNVAQAFTNLGVIQLNHATASFTAPRVDNAGRILGHGVFNAALNNTVAGVVSNDGTGGTLVFSNAVNNAGSMVALNNSGLAFDRAVNNAGGALIGAGNSGVVTFNAAVTNAAGGILGMRNQGTLIFNAGLTNNGVLGFDVALNPSTAIINGTLLLGSSGTISMTHTNDTLVMRGDFVNGSTDTNGFNMRSGTMIFGSAVRGVTNTFEVAGTNKGAVFSGFDNNMALGTLNITNHISFVNQLNNGGGPGTSEALYVDVLRLFNGATLKLSQLTVYVGMQFIYEDGAGTKVLTGAAGDAITAANKDVLGLANVFLDAGGQIVFVPEPSTSVLIGLGLAALAGGRRRKTRGRGPA